MFNAAICSQAAKTDEIVVAHLYTVGGRGGNEGWAVVGVSVGARAAITLCFGRLGRFPRRFLHCRRFSRRPAAVFTLRRRWRLTSAFPLSCRGSNMHGNFLDLLFPVERGVVGVVDHVGLVLVQGLPLHPLGGRVLAWAVVSPPLGGQLVVQVVGGLINQAEEEAHHVLEGLLGRQHGGGPVDIKGGRVIPVLLALSEVCLIN